MSRTDKTAPWRVKATFKATYLTEDHDHRNGPCDLPPRPKGSPSDAPGWTGRGEHRCFWTYSTEFFCSGLSRCGCAMCDGTNWEGSTNRRTRREGKKYARGDWRNEY